MANTIGAYNRDADNDIGAYERYAAPATGQDYPQGLLTIDKGINPQRATSLGGELQE